MGGQPSKAVKAYPSARITVEELAYYRKAVVRSGYMILLYLLQYFIPAFPPHYSVYEAMAKYYRRMEVSLSKLGSSEPITRRKRDWDGVKPLHSLPGACIGVTRVKVSSAPVRGSLDEVAQLLPASTYIASLRRLHGAPWLEAVYYTPLRDTYPAYSLPGLLYEAQRHGYQGPPGTGRLEGFRMRGDPVVYDVAYPVRVRGECFEPIDKCITERWSHAFDAVLGLNDGAEDPYFKLLIEENLADLKYRAREKVFSRALRDYMAVDVSECFRFNVACRCELRRSGRGRGLRVEEYPYYLIILSAHMESPVLKEFKLFKEAWPRAVLSRLRHLEPYVRGVQTLYRALMPRPASAFRRALYSLIARGVVLGVYVGYCVRCEQPGYRVDVELYGVDEGSMRVIASALSYTPITPVIYYSTREQEAWFTGLVNSVSQLRTLLSIAARKGLLQDFVVRRVERSVNYTLPFEMYSPTAYKWVLDNTTLLWEMHYASLQAWCRRILRCYEVKHRGGGRGIGMFCKLLEEMPNNILGTPLRELEASKLGLI